VTEERALRVVRDVSSAPRSATAPPSPSDRAEALSSDLLACAKGDEEAFERLYGAVSASVFGIALRVVRDRAMAEEVAQEALVEVWRVAARYRADKGSARSWILTIAHRRAVDKVRSEQAHTDRLQAHGPHFEPEHQQPDHIVDVAYGQWEAERVRVGLATLTARQREALDLTYFKGYTHREVAESLGIPLGTAKARIRDGLIKLRDAWEEER